MMVIKKRMILLIVVLGLSSCNFKSEDAANVEKAEMIQEREASDSQEDSEKYPVMVQQGDKSIHLYECMVADMSYSEKNGCVFADGAGLSYMLPDMAVDLPSATWGDDLEVRISQEHRFY